MPDRGAIPDVLPPDLADDLRGGTFRPILTHPHPLLSVRCDPSGYLPGHDLRQLVRDLLATMYAAGGWGLAAPQIGNPVRALVMDAGWKFGMSAPVAMLDPEIVARSDDEAEEVETCLSIPGQPVSVSRARHVQVLWYDLHGVRQMRMLIEAEARIVQHEIDHLDGRLIVDPRP